MPDTVIADQILRALKWQRRFIVFLAVCLFALLGVFIYYTLQTRTALCTFRGDLVQRATTSQTFLDTHPHGGFGLTRAQIQVGIDNQQRTINALAGLHCSTPTNAKGAP